MGVLDGDRAKAGFCSFGALMPAGYGIAPHHHHNAERVNVLSGTMQLGHGEQFDQSKLQSMPAGTYSSMSAGMRQFPAFKEDTVIQVSTLGPWGITYVNPADEPRNSASK